MLHAHHGTPVAPLVDEYDGPVMTGHTNGYHREAADFLNCYDITPENSARMLMPGLCFGLPGCADPRPSKEAGYGRFDIQVEPPAKRSLMYALAAPLRPQARMGSSQNTW